MIDEDGVEHTEVERNLPNGDGNRRKDKGKVLELQLDMAHLSWPTKALTRQWPLTRPKE